MNNPFAEFESMMRDFGESIRFLFTITILNIPLFFWIIFIGMILLYLYLLIFPASVDTMLSNAFLRLAAWDRSLLHYEISETNAPSNLKGRISRFFTVILIGVLSAIRIGFILWIGMGALLLINTIIVIFLQLSNSSFITNGLSFEFFTPIAMPLAVSLLLLVSGGFLLQLFRKRLRGRSEAMVSIADFKMFLFLLLAIVNAMITILSIYQIYYGTILIILVMRFVPFLLFLFFITDSRFSNKSTPFYLIFWFFILGVGSTTVGIQLGAVPFFFLIAFIIRIFPNLALLSPNTAGANPAETVSTKPEIKTGESRSPSG